MSMADSYSRVSDLLQQARTTIEGLKAPDRDMLLAIDRFLAGDGQTQDRPWRTTLPVAAAVFRTAGITCSPFVPLVEKPGFGAIVIQAPNVMVRVYLEHSTVYDPPATAVPERAWHFIKQRPMGTVMATGLLLGISIIAWSHVSAMSVSQTTSDSRATYPSKATSAPLAPSRRSEGQDRSQEASAAIAGTDEDSRERKAFVEARLIRTGEVPTESAIRDGVRRLADMTSSPRPRTGWLSGIRDGQAPFAVKCRTDTIIVLEDKYSGRIVATYFCRGGQTLETQVPLGTYRLKYGSGDVWYGPVLAFGPGTRGSPASYAEADSDFVFQIVGNYVEGHRIELIMQAHGNLSTDPIPVSSF